MLSTEYLRVAYQQADSSAVRISLDTQVGSEGALLLADRQHLLS